MKVKKEITIDDLAVMVQKGFQGVDKRFESIEDRMVTKDMLSIVVDSIDIIREDVRDIKIRLGPLVHMVAAMDTDIAHLNIRVTRLEQRGGLIKK